jgi:(p)ppGpp synthase/HD superfamily hydrolase
MVLSNRFEEALIFATRLHARQVRKASSIPYVSHLLIVAGMVLEQGGDEDTAIAALLHDAVEDQGGRPMLDEIRRRFGDRVADIVEECSDAFTFFKPPWRKRKEAYLAHLPHASAAARLVSAADKLHNARTTLADYRTLGESLWRRFNGGREGTLWFYRAMVEALRAGEPSPLVEELDRVVSELERLASAKGDT